MVLHHKQLDIENDIFARLPLWCQKLLFFFRVQSEQSNLNQQNEGNYQLESENEFNENEKSNDERNIYDDQWLIKRRKRI